MRGNKCIALALGQLCLILLICQTTKSQPEEAQPVIETKSGKVRGIRVKAAYGKEVDAYYGIPFAKPPIGNLRFRHPEKVEPWQGVLEANTKSDMCYQRPVDLSLFTDKVTNVRHSPHNMSEDCLYLNIWVPTQAPDPKEFAVMKPVEINFFSEKMSNVLHFPHNMSEDCLYLNIWVPRPAPYPKECAVMVWIHGGSFFFGSSVQAMYDGQNIASERNVIVVSMNYRLASLGFLYVKGRTDAPGNAGMFDQIMALQWIQDNIEAFGGLKNKVTLFGESAGAASVAMHLLSPLSKNLFNNAILQSGTALSSWAIANSEDMNRRALRLGNIFDCKNDRDRDAFMECLRSVDAKELALKDYLAVQMTLTPYPPIVDGIFLLEDPKETLKSGKFNPAKIIVGNTKNEGGLISGTFVPFTENATVTREQFLQFTKIFLTDFTDLQIETIIHEYTNWSSVNDVYGNRDLFVQMIGDLNFHCPSQDFASAYIEQNNDVYSYQYAHRFPFIPTPSWTGVKHMDDIPFTFGTLLHLPHNDSSDNIRMTSIFMEYWTNFAKTGNPNGNSNDDAGITKWEKSTKGDKKYLILDANPRMQNGLLRPKQCAMWRELLFKLCDSKCLAQNR